MLLNPQFIRKGQMTMVGLSMLGNSSSDISTLWKRFEEIEPNIYNAGRSGRYVIITWGVETELSEQQFIFTGIEVQKLQSPPLTAVIKILPAGQYAVFSSWAREFDNLWRYAMDDWLEMSPYDMPGFIIQHYDSQRYFRARPARREVDLLIPLREKKKG